MECGQDGSTMLAGMERYDGIGMKLNRKDDLDDQRLIRRQLPVPVVVGDVRIAAGGGLMSVIRKW